MSLVLSHISRELDTYSQTNLFQGNTYLEHSVYELSDHKGVVNEVKFSRDGQLLASCAEEVILWRLNHNIESIGSLRPHKLGVTSLSWSFDSLSFVTSSADKTLCVQDTNKGLVIRRIKSHKNIINSVSFLEEYHNLIVSGDDDGYVYIHDLRCKNHINQIRSSSPVISISNLSNYLLIGGACGNVYYDSIDFENQRIHLLSSIEGESIIYGTSLSSNGKYGCSVDNDGYLKIFNTQSSCDKESRIVSSIKYCQSYSEVSPIRCEWHDDYIMCGGCDKLLRIWNVEDVYNPILKYELPGHKGSVTGVSFHPTSPIIASCSTDGFVIVGELSN